jgi:hypothetical protein
VSVKHFAPNNKIIVVLAFSAALAGWSFALQNIEITAQASPKSALIGDAISISFEIPAPPGYQAEPALPGSTAGNFSIIETSHDGLHARIVAAAYKTGRFAFPPIQFRIKTPEGNAVTAMSPSIDIEIKSILPDKNATLKGLKSQIELPAGNRLLLWSLLALAGCSAAALWVVARKRPRGVKNPPSPPQNVLDEAEADLRKLADRGMPDGSAIKETYIELSQIISRILEQDLGISAFERTTDEIVHSMAGLQCEQRTMRSIESILTRCDLVKFAKYVPSQQEHQELLNNALQFIEGRREGR